MSETPGKYSEIIGAKSAGKPASKKAGKPASRKTKKEDSPQTSKPDKEVNLCARVPESHRRWWAGQSKMAGKSMTQVIKDALAAEFGLPPD